MPRNPGAETRRHKPLLYAVAAVLILAVIIGYSQLRSSSAPGTAPTGPDTIVRMCTKCGTVSESAADELRKKGYLDLEGIALFGEGKLCQKCQKATLEFATKCPKDGTAFIPSQGTDRCPKCGWKPAPSS